MLQLEIANKCRELIELNPPKFKIGDSVMSKKTGLPVIGTIIGIQTSYSYFLEHQHFDRNRWNNLFPNWDKKYVYTLIFDEKIIPLNLDEYNYYKDKYKDSELKMPSYDEYPKYPVIHYPEDDLELF